MNAQAKITTETIDHLARLSRISVPDNEKQALVHEIGAIVSYVATIASATANTDVEPRPGAVKNILREDIATVETGTYTKVLVESAPRHQGDYVTVKKIIAD